MRGDKQVQEVDFFASYTPVSKWTAIHLILILSIILNWVTVQSDNTNAYAQGMLDEEILMEIPKDFVTQDVDNDYVHD